MKKSKLSIGLMTCLLSVGSLAGCDNLVKSSNKGVLISINGKEIRADGLLEEYFEDTANYDSIYSTIKSLVVRNYFNVDGLSVEKSSYVATADGYTKKSTTVELGKGDMNDINKRADEKVAIDKDTAKTNAANNNTSLKKELEAICESKGVEYDKNLENLHEKYVEEIKEEMFEKDFEKYYASELTMGAGEVDDKKLSKMSERTKGTWEGYFKSQVPYHISHILVKLENGASSYADATISEDEAKNLFNVVNSIAFSDDNFATIARMYKGFGDTGSAEKGGDLGVVDYQTATEQYVKEFGLGIYAYENVYRPIIKNKTSLVDADSHVNMGESQEKFMEAAKGSFAIGELENDVPLIDYTIFDEINKYAEITEANNESVIGGSQLVYPRNIVFNRSLNRHSIAFISGPSDLAIKTDSSGVEYKYVENKSDTPDVTYYGRNFKEEKATSATGFYKFDGISKPILSVKVAGEWQPILCVRAESGIHFIVINRSAFTVKADDEGANGVNMEDYYAPYYPEQLDSFPKTTDGKNMSTYVNFGTNDKTETMSRAESLANKFKSFDSDRLDKYKFLKFKEIEDVKISNEKLEAKLNEWIKTSLEKKDQERKEKWDEIWSNYIDTLLRQGDEREKLVSNTCKLIFEGANARKTLGEYVDAKFPTQASAIYAEIAAYYSRTGAADLLKLDGTKLVDGVEITSITSETVKKAALDSVFTVKGGLCNDGQNH